jgi:hypothetical protein
MFMVSFKIYERMGKNRKKMERHNMNARSFLNQQLEQ